MDYKYIEQLLDRYWNCETTLQEEDILKAFFSQENVPAELARYKSLFVYEQEQTALSLGSDFDDKVLAAVAAENDASTAADTTAPTAKTVKAAHISLFNRLRPLYRAAAAVAIITLLGTAAQHSFTSSDKGAAGSWDYDQSAYKDSYQDPQKAYEAGMETLRMFKEGAQTAVNDSAKHGTEVRKSTANPANSRK